MKSLMITTILAAGIFSAHATIADDMTAWSGRINLGGFVTDGNTDKKSLTLDGLAKARQADNRYTVGAETRYAQDSGTDTEDEYMVYGEYDRFINEKIFIGARASYETDNIADLDSRINVGPYVGYQYFESEELNLNTRLGANFIAEEYASGDREEDIGALWGINYDQKFFDGAVQAFYKHDLTLPMDNTDNFLLDMETGVRFPIANVLTGTAQIDLDWDGEPAAGKEEKDTKYSIKVGYAF
jgi:putative salt-induced outer membrane protein YdiY